eukprot:scaffold267223_cov27-Tisochrysis_lutea.AAC.2
MGARGSASSSSPISSRRSTRRRSTVLARSSLRFESAAATVSFAAANDRPRTTPDSCTSASYSSSLSSPASSASSEVLKDSRGRKSRTYREMSAVSGHRCEARGRVAGQRRLGVAAHLVQLLRPELRDGGTRGRADPVDHGLSHLKGCQDGSHLRPKLR